MARIVCVIALLCATLVFGGCAGIPYGALGALGGLAGGGYGGGYGNAYGAYGGGYGGGAAYPQGGIPIPVPMDPGYGGGYGAPGYGSQPYYQQQPYGYNNQQPYGYNNGAGYPGQQNPQYSADEVNRRLQHQADRLQAGIASGQITPEEATRLQAEQSRIQAAMTRMQTSNGNLSPGELARLNQMLNYSGRDIYGQSHNGTTVPAPVAGNTTTGTGTTATGTGTGTTVAGNGTTTTGTGTTGTGSTVQAGAAQQRPGSGARYGQNPQMAGPRMQPNMAGPRVQPNMAGPRMQPNMAGPRVQPNMAGPRVQPRAVQPAAAPRVAPTAGRSVAAVPGR